VVSEQVRSPSGQGFEACCGFKHLQQSPTSFWYYHNPFVRPYTVSIIVGPHALQGFFFTLRIFIHHYKENHTWIHYIHTWIHYIHWSATFSTNLQGVHAAHGGSTTSTTTHAALQTLGILCGPLHSTNFKEVLRPLHNISEALPYLIRNISSISQMGISWNLIWLPGLRDIID
jgi:hypothetical protein